jgi:hypothetical protein
MILCFSPMPRNSDPSGRSGTAPQAALLAFSRDEQVGHENLSGYKIGHSAKKADLGRP